MRDFARNKNRPTLHILPEYLQTNKSPIQHLKKSPWTRENTGSHLQIHHSHTMQIELLCTYWSNAHMQTGFLQTIWKQDSDGRKPKSLPIWAISLRVIIRQPVAKRREICRWTNELWTTFNESLQLEGAGLRKSPFWLPFLNLRAFPTSDD
jgi:predicted RNA binding protein YcfA (HicA-like mRNA interferase family)